MRRLSIALCLYFCFHFGLSPLYLQAQNVEIIIYRDADSLTLYLPPAITTASLQGLRLEVIDARNNFISRGLDEYPAFRSLSPFTRLPTPLCLRLERDGSDRVTPLECSGIMIVTQPLTDANVFWYDAATNQALLVSVVRASEPITFCPAENAACSFSYEPIDLGITSTAPAQSLQASSLLGLSGNPVTANNQWIPFVQEFHDVEMMLVPTGCFVMGSNEGRENEFPAHEMCFDEPFWIDKIEVTNQQYRSIGWWADALRPREVISWFEASDYCAARDSRLLTEAEWEYAASGPDNLEYPWGNQFEADRVVYGHNSTSQTDFVGERPGGASWVGALDMSGNVWEWVSSIDTPYPYSREDGRENLSDKDRSRVMRGGSWLNADNVLTTSFRVSDAPTFRLNNVGFRCGMTFVSEQLDMIAFANRELASPTREPQVYAPMLRMTAGVNLRSGPGTNYTVIGSVRSNDMLYILAQTTNDGIVWYQVRDFNGQPKWVIADYAEVVNPEGVEIPTARTTPVPP